MYIGDMKTELRPKIQARIKRIVEEDRYCVDILNQISALRSALDALGVELLTSHIETCVIGCGTDAPHVKAKPMNPDHLLAELRKTLSRFLK